MASVREKDTVTIIIFCKLVMTYTKKLHSFILTLEALPRQWVALETADSSASHPSFSLSSIQPHIVIVRLITVLYILCLSLTGTFLSQMTPVTSLHLFHASRTRFLQSVVVPPSASNIDPRYLNVVTVLISSPPSLTLS